MAFEADPAAFAASLRRTGRRTGASHRRGARIGRRCGVAGQRITAHRRVVCGVRRRRDAGRPGDRAHRGRRMRPGVELTPSRKTTSGWPPSWRCRTGAGATRSTIRAGPPAARRCDGADAGAGVATRIPTRIRRTAEGRRRRIRMTLHRRGIRRSAPRPSAAPSGVFRTRTLVVPGVGEGAPGRRSRARNRTGTVVSATTDPEEGHGVHVFATLLAAARRQQRPGRPRPEPDDVRRAIREGREGQPGDLRRRRVGFDGRA